MINKSSTDKQWVSWGKSNPYYGVLGIETKRLDNAVAVKDFMNSGELHIAGVLEDLRRHFGFIPMGGKALDFGCGVGRLLPPLTRNFDFVTGVDISDEMLKLAAQNTEGLKGVNFFNSLSQIAPNEKFDFVHSFIVLQHIRSKQGLKLIDSLVKLVRPGGFFSLHMTINDVRRLRRILNFFRYRLHFLHWGYNIYKGRPWDEPITEMNNYNLSQIIKLLADQIDGVIVLKKYDHNGHLGVMISAKKK